MVFIPGTENNSYFIIFDQEIIHKNSQNQLNPAVP